MEYNEALDIVARLRTQHQALEKMDEVLTKARGAENHVSELINQRDELQRQIKEEENLLREVTNRRNTAATEYETRLKQLKVAETKARQEKDKALAEWISVKAHNHEKHRAQLDQLQQEYGAKRKALEGELAGLKEEIEKNRQSIQKMKEFARSVV